MVERKSIGLYYNYNKEWIAGTYYILNIIKALNKLTDREKPFLVIFYNNHSEISLVKELAYPYISFFKFKTYSNVIYRIVNKIAKLTGFDTVFYDRKPSQMLKKYYPYNYQLKGFSENFVWIPDFQEHFYPEFFSLVEVASRKKNHAITAVSGKNIVFSSEDAKENFIRFYQNNTCKLHVLKFASVLLDTYTKIPIESLLLKYNIQKPYFIISNQFWKHKNHITVLKAIVEIKKLNNTICFVFTGKPKDTRDANFFKELIYFCDEHKINNQVKFLGFIDREEQLQLMNNAEAIIQPSLFEGWSTTVEDAKFLNKFIILSDIPLHREQMKDNVIFFSKQNEKELASLILEFVRKCPHKTANDYNTNIVKFAKEFVEIMS